jgi:hypothetical protein
MTSLEGWGLSPAFERAKGKILRRAQNDMAGDSLRTQDPRYDPKPQLPSRDL